ncbi:unnamed protein product, partial [marine sediment metagenome]
PRSEGKEPLETLCLLFSYSLISYKLGRPNNRKAYILVRLA